MRGATLEVGAMVATLGRLADLLESWYRSEIWTQEVAEGLARELEDELGMDIRTLTEAGKPYVSLRAD